MTTPLATPEPFETLTNQLSSTEQSTLRQGKPVVSVSGNQFVGHIVAMAEPEAVWDVLTDYENFSEFLPTVVSSQILKSEGDRKVVEQVDSRNVLLTDIESTVRTENIEEAQTHIDFNLIEGDLKNLEGRWHVHPIADDSDLSQTLIVQTVTAEAGAGLFEGAFHSIFEDSLKGNLEGIKQEAEQRSPD
ncbi:MAG: SRPBCC family protein [Elainellaceae cyanobacterium]